MHLLGLTTYESDLWLAAAAILLLGAVFSRVSGRVLEKVEIGAEYFGAKTAEPGHEPQPFASEIAFTGLKVIQISEVIAETVRKKNAQIIERLKIEGARYRQLAAAQALVVSELAVIPASPQRQQLSRAPVAGRLDKMNGSQQWSKLATIVGDAIDGAGAAREYQISASHQLDAVDYELHSVLEELSAVMPVGGLLGERSASGTQVRRSKGVRRRGYPSVVQSRSKFPGNVEPAKAASSAA